ncbi:MAG TPA: radical SAM protein [Planctomycetota bacterium]|nr:radical SAM protein [Planctomycetota bacterium]
MSALSDGVVERSMARAIPLSAHVDLTMRCNELCVHCYRVIEDRRELTTGEVKALLADLAKAGTLYLTFSGGEIFLRQDLFELIAEAKRLRFDLRLKSNALLISEERARRLRELGVRQVDVSIYSVEPAVHDAVTKIPGSLERSLAGIERLRAAGVSVKINCPLMRSNVAGYRDVRALAERLGAACGIDPMITARNDGDPSTVRLRIGRADLARVLRDPVLSPEPLPTEIPDVRPDLDDIACGAGHNACYVSAYGDVMPCVALPLACGNIRETPFGEIWADSRRMREVRSIRVRNLHTCAGCEAAAFCTRCPGQALVEDGDLYGPSRAACEHAMAGAELAGVAVVPASLAPPNRSPR